jgi:hypothetical protein
MAEPIPVVLFAYARPLHLARVLACLKENAVPLVYAYADGAKGTADAAAVAETRALLRGIDWCELRLTERPANLGLGRNVLAGVGEVAARHDAFLVWEDDLICVPGTYGWLAGLLERYRENPRVFSVAGWTHPRLVPRDAGVSPYFDGRAECWVWGAYARSWRGMEESLVDKLHAVHVRGIKLGDHGADLPAMAEECTRKNTWAIRWICHHLQHGGLCVRPPWSLVEHIGFDRTATNAAGALQWINPPLRLPPVLSLQVAEPKEHPACGRLWRATTEGRLQRILRPLRRILGHE